MNMGVAEVIADLLWRPLHTYLLTLWTPRVYFKSLPTKPNCLRVHQPESQIVFSSVEQSV